MSSELWEDAAWVLLSENDVFVNRYRSSTTGYAQPKLRRIEAPEPRGPLSFAVLAHEVGHVVLHAKGSRPRWVEEVEAWEFALHQIQRFDLPGYERVERKAARSIEYAFAKAIRRGVALSTIAETYPVWWAAAGATGRGLAAAAAAARAELA